MGDFGNRVNPAVRLGILEDAPLLVQGLLDRRRSFGEVTRAWAPARGWRSRHVRVLPRSVGRGGAIRHLCGQPSSRALRRRAVQLCGRSEFSQSSLHAAAKKSEAAGASAHERKLLRKEDARA